MTPADGAPPPPGALPAPPAGAPPAPPGRQISVRLPVQRVWATYMFLGLITLVFVGQLALTQFAGQDYIAAFGAKDNQAIAQGEYWRLLTAIFVHANILHYAFNAYALYIIGRDVERFYGGVRLAVIFLLAGLSGSVFSLIFTLAPSVGASGAIFGLIGAEAVFLFRHRQLFGDRARRALQNIILVALINFGFGLSVQGIDNWAHLGGLTGGLILGWVLSPLWTLSWDAMQGGQPVIVDQQPLGGRQWLLAAAFAVAVAALAIVGASLYVSPVR